MSGLDVDHWMHALKADVRVWGLGARSVCDFGTATRTRCRRGENHARGCPRPAKARRRNQRCPGVFLPSYTLLGGSWNLVTRVFYIYLLITPIKVLITYNLTYQVPRCSKLGSKGPYNWVFRFRMVVMQGITRQSLWV